MTMKIIFRPMNDYVDRKIRYTAERVGDVLFIDGVEYDFTPLPEGASLPATAITTPEEVFRNEVSRVDGELVVELVLYFAGQGAPESTRFPEPIRLTSDGIIVFPQQEADELVVEQEEPQDE